MDELALLRFIRNYKSQNRTPITRYQILQEGISDQLLQKLKDEGKLKSYSFHEYIQESQEDNSQ